MISPIIESYWSKIAIPSVDLGIQGLTISETNQLKKGQFFNILT